MNQKLKNVILILVPIMAVAQGSQHNKIANLVKQFMQQKNNVLKNYYNVIKKDCENKIDDNNIRITHGTGRTKEQKKRLEKMQNKAFLTKDKIQEIIREKMK